MKKNKMQLKGQLRMYMRWPLIMTLLLIGMDVWVYMVDKKAGLLMSVFIIIYVGIAFSLYFYNRSLILADLIQFSVQYKGIENRLLKELAIPYAIALEDGRILWKNDCFLNLTEGQRKERYLNRMIPESESYGWHLKILSIQYFEVARPMMMNYSYLILLSVIVNV